MDKPKKYTNGFKDIEMVMEHLEDRERAARRAEWLKNNANPSKDGKEPDVKVDA